jgi:hypothetical protein
MAANQKLTHVVKDRVVQSFQLNASELQISFVDGSTMKVKIVESPATSRGCPNSPDLRGSSKTCHRMRGRQHSRRNIGRSR